MTTRQIMINAIVPQNEPAIVFTGSSRTRRILRRVVIAIIADTERRQRVINLKANKEDVCTMYELLNRAVDKAFQGIEANLRSMLMDDFCNGSGYDRSLSSSVISQRAYYRRKRKIIADVAVLLCLI